MQRRSLNTAVPVVYGTAGRYRLEIKLPRVLHPVSLCLALSRVLTVRLSLRSCVLVSFFFLYSIYNIPREPSSYPRRFNYSINTLRAVSSLRILNS